MTISRCVQKSKSRMPAAGVDVRFGSKPEIKMNSHLVWCLTPLRVKACTTAKNLIDCQTVSCPKYEDAAVLVLAELTSQRAPRRSRADNHIVVGRVYQSDLSLRLTFFT